MFGLGWVNDGGSPQGLDVPFGVPEFSSRDPYPFGPAVELGLDVKNSAGLGPVVHGGVPDDPGGEVGQRGKIALAITGGLFHIELLIMFNVEPGAVLGGAPGQGGRSGFSGSCARRPDFVPETLAGAVQGLQQLPHQSVQMDIRNQVQEVMHRLVELPRVRRFMEFLGQLSGLAEEVTKVDFEILGRGRFLLLSSVGFLSEEPAPGQFVRLCGRVVDLVLEFPLGPRRLATGVVVLKEELECPVGCKAKTMDEGNCSRCLGSRNV